MTVDVNTYTTLPNPTYSGYIFTGWYTATSGGSYVAAGGGRYRPTSDITLYGHWVLEVKITYNGNGGTPAGAGYEVTGQGYGVTLPNATRPGYVMAGWTIGSATYSVGAMYYVNANVTAYAIWKQSCTVTYDVVDPGARVDPLDRTSDTVYEDAVIYLPNAILDHYDFMGWYTQMYGQGTRVGGSGSAYTVTSTLSLYAFWRAQYVVTFVTNNDTTVDPKYASPGTSVTMPILSKTYYKFDGWYDSNNTFVVAGGSPYAPTSDITLYGHWTQIGGPTGDGTWEVVSNGTDTYNLTLTFSTVNAAMMNYTSATDTGIRNTGDLERWTVNSYNEHITAITFNLVGAAANVTIGTYAFAGITGVTSVILPNGISVIGAHSFEDCTGLRNIDTGAGVTSIGAYAFNGCDAVRVVEMGQNVKTIREYAFALNNDGTVTLVYVPNSVSTIEANAFYGLSFRSNESETNIDYTVPENFVGYSYVRSTASPYLYRQSDWYVIHEGNEYILYIAKSGPMDDYNPYGAPWYTDYPTPENPDPTLITSVVLRSGVTSIGNYALAYYPNMTSVDIPGSVLYIGKYAFAESSIASVTMPGSVISIGDCAFQNCTDLTEVILGDNVTIIGDNAFDGCTALTDLTLPIDLNISTNSMFEGMTYLRRINIVRGKSGVGTAYTAAYDLETNTFVGTYTYTPWYKSMSNGLTVVLKAGILSVGQATFFHNTGLISLTIPDTVISIGSYAFSHCSELTSLTIPSNIKTIYAHTFENCTSLATLNIGGSVTSIGDYAFRGCSAITSLIIPNSVTAIGYQSFVNCTALTQVIVGTSVTSIGNDILGDGDDTLVHEFANAFLGCTKLFFVFNLSALDIVAGATTHGYVAYYAKRVYDYFDSTGDNEFVAVDGYVFSKIEGKFYLIGYTGSDTALTPPSSFTYDGETISSYAIYDKAFLNSGIVSIALPSSVTGIGEYAFYGCTSLTSVTYNGVNCRAIGDYAFYGCTALTSTTLPANLKTIGSYAFSECGLTSVTIPAYVSSMGEGAFMDVNSGGSSLQSVIFSGATSIPAYCFMGCSALTSVTASNIKAIGASAFENCTALTSITIADSVTLVGESAFAGCSGLTSITIGDKVKNIDVSAFPGFTFYEYMGGGITSVTKLPGYTYTGSEYVFRQQGNAFKFVINYYLHNNVAYATETYTFKIRATSCYLNKWGTDSNGKVIRTVRSSSDYYESEGQTWRFQYWTTGAEGVTGARLLPGDVYDMSIEGVNEGEENVATMNLYAHYIRDDNINLYLKKYSRQKAAKFQQETQSLDWYTEDGVSNLIPLFETTFETEDRNSTSYKPGSIVYGVSNSNGTWSYYYLGADNEISDNDEEYQLQWGLNPTYDIVGVTFDLSSCYIQTLSRTIKASLTTISTIIYGAENRFVMDLGNTMTYSLRISRVNPPNAVPIDGYEFKGREFTWESAQNMDWTTWYVIKDEIGFENLTNGDFFRLLLIFVDEWQNNLRDSDNKLTGGFEFFCSSIDLEQFNKIDKRVFIAGSIQQSTDGQLMSLTIPMTVASMQADDTSRENVTIEARFASTIPEDLSEGIESVIQYSYPMSSAVPVPLPQAEWEEYWIGRNKTFSYWKTDKNEQLHLGDMLPVDRTGIILIAVWDDGIAEDGNVSDYSNITDDGIDTFTDKTLNEIFDGKLDRNLRYSVDFTLIGAGGGGAPADPYSNGWVNSYAGGGGGGSGGVVSVTIVRIDPEKDLFSRTVGLGGTSFGYDISEVKVDGGNTTLTYKRYNSANNYVTYTFVAGGGKSAGMRVSGSSLVGSDRDAGAGGTNSIPSEDEYVISIAEHPGYSGGTGGHDGDGADGGCDGTLGVGGKGGKYQQFKESLLITSYVWGISGGGGGAASRFSFNNGQYCSTGGDGATYNTAGTKPTYGGGGAGAAYAKDMKDAPRTYFCYRTNGANGYMRIAIRSAEDA